MADLQERREVRQRHVVLPRYSGVQRCPRTQSPPDIEDSEAQNGLAQQERVETKGITNRKRSRAHNSENLERTFFGSNNLRLTYDVMSARTSCYPLKNETLPNEHGKYSRKSEVAMLAPSSVPRAIQPATRTLVRMSIIGKNLLIRGETCERASRSASKLHTNCSDSMATV
jgi:hypothetical protein